MRARVLHVEGVVGASKGSALRDLLHREGTLVERVGVGEGGGDRRFANQADRHGLDIVAGRVEGVTVNTGHCSVLSHLAGGADRELFRAGHGGRVTQDIRDLSLFLGLVREGARVREGVLFRVRPLGAAGCLDHLESIVGSSDGIQQVDLRGLLVFDRQARASTGTDGELRVLPHVARRQSGVGRRGVLTQVGDRRTHWERCSEASLLAALDNHRGRAGALVRIERAALVFVRRRRPFRVVVDRGARRKLIVEGHLEADVCIYVLDIVGGDRLYDAEGTLTLPHLNIDGPRHSEIRSLLPSKLGSFNQNTVGVVGSRKRRPTDEESLVGD